MFQSFNCIKDKVKIIFLRLFTFCFILTDRKLEKSIENLKFEINKVNSFCYCVNTKALYI